MQAIHCLQVIWLGVNHKSFAIGRCCLFHHIILGPFYGSELQKKKTNEKQEPTKRNKGARKSEKKEM